MSDAGQTWIDIAKAVGFVIAGTLGIVALVAFFQGFRDGYRGEQPTEASANTAAEAETQPMKILPSG